MAAALGGQAMNTAWSAFRISSLISWRDIHIKYVVWGACSGVDVLQVSLFVSCCEDPV
jgi:hypothetical protein